VSHYYFGGFWSSEEGAFVTNPPPPKILPGGYSDEAPGALGPAQRYLGILQKYLENFVQDGTKGLQS